MQEHGLTPDMLAGAVLSTAVVVFIVRLLVVRKTVSQEKHVRGQLQRPRWTEDTWEDDIEPRLLAVFPLALVLDSILIFP